MASYDDQYIPGAHAHLSWHISMDGTLYVREMQTGVTFKLTQAANGIGTSPSTSAGIGEAPFDGQVYSRQSGDWTPNLIQPKPTRVITIDNINPSSIAAGSVPFTLECNSVSGTFVSGDEIYWNGAPILTWFISANQLQATILSDPVANPGTFPVHVQGSDGTISNQMNFIVTGAARQEVLTDADGADSISLSCVSGGDLVVTAVSGPNVGKSVNLTYGKWT